MTGKYQVKLDEKNRLIVPSKIREELGENFVITVGVNCGYSCLTIYTESDWQNLTNNYNQLPLVQRAGPASLIFMNATECTPDKQFRFMVTENLLRYANIGREAVFAGCAGRAEIWDVEKFKEYEEIYLNPSKLLESYGSINL